MADKIVVKGAKQNNLKNVTVEIPRDKLVVFTGLSGSGKSTLAFDTIFCRRSKKVYGEFVKLRSPIFRSNGKA